MLKPKHEDTIRVFIADDHPLVVEGLRALLAANGIEVVGEAGSGDRALAEVLTLRPDVVLMDVRMPEMDGLTATRAIKDRLPEAATRGP